MFSRFSLYTNYRILCTTNNVKQKILTNRSMHLSCQIGSGSVKTFRVLTISKQNPILGAAFVRHASSENASVQSVPAINPLDQIPDAPVPNTLMNDVSEVITSVGEPSLSSIGLGGYTPVGMVQQCLQFLHIGCDLPWWAAIVVGTVCVRILLFPLVILSQKNAAKMNNYLPQMQHLQMKLTEARQSGNQIEAARYAQELLLFMKQKDLNPLKNMIVPVAQAPIFLSFFMGLRKMTNVPIESMRDGGLWWFTDLTVPDPLYILPIITSATLWVTIELGTDSAKLEQFGMFRYVLRLVPLCILPFTINFPGAILCYWVSTNFISLIQVGILKIPKVRNYFKIDAMITHDKSKLPANKGFVKGFKESWTNMKISRQLNERARVDEIEFQKAGRGPIVKTYPYDPTNKNSTNSAAILTKKR
ncbi:mitochondrial inner membrane protein OXA1L [Cephus cinctus]|uniref:Mitochondrial inner membrane protein OXA1L n=1 Tax=Cephus cinctus TaxID=211228 RepID=A0AAJ7CE46_CEPCN|nr:mitochondrial inner membrane protein OXA1L [Cephus cinctus]